MRARDFITEELTESDIAMIAESSRPTNTSFPDGKVWINDHLISRMRERNIDSSSVTDLINRAIATKGEAIAQLDPMDFVLREPSGLGLAIRKFENADGTYRYVLLTVHPHFAPGHRQMVVTVREAAT